MKRLATCLAAVLLVICAARDASAVDIKVKGVWDFGIGWADNLNFLRKGHKNQRGGGNDHFYARHRIRTQIDFIVSEAVNGVLMFEIGNLEWGQRKGNVGRSSGSGLDADGVNIETKRAYLEWMVPNTGLAVRMGIQNMSLPMATGYCSPIMYADVAGVSMSYVFSQNVAAGFFWARPFDLTSNDGDYRLHDEMDMFALTVPITLPGVRVTPWAMYSGIGAASGYFNYIINYQGSAFSMLDADQSDKTNAWWAGVALDVSAFNPVRFTMDAMYGDLDKVDLYDRGGDKRMIGTKGWFIDAKLEYYLSWGTPGLIGWWSSGDKANADSDGGYGRIPVVGVDGTYGPTSFGFGGTAGLGIDGIVSPTAVGTWGIGVQLADAQLIERLTHTLRIAYYEGTNDHRLAQRGRFLPLSAEAVYLTDRDSAIEVNFDHTFRMYENLSVILETGYIHLDLDGETWNAHSTANKGRVGAQTDDAWKAQILFKYRF